MDQLRASAYAQGKTNGLVLNFGAETTAGVVYEDFVLPNHVRSCTGAFWWNAEVRRCILNDTGIDVGLAQAEAL